MKIVVNLASSLDGKIKANGKDASDEKDYKRAYSLRPNFDAILVGAQTIINDNPRLTSKGLGKDPRPIVLDRRGIIPKDARIHSRGPVVLSSVKRNIKGEVITQDFSWKNIKKILSEIGISSVIVEGGGKVIRSLIEEKAWDEFMIYYGPFWFGNQEDLTPMVNGSLEEAFEAKVKSVEVLGEGFLVKLVPKQ